MVKVNENSGGQGLHDSHGTLSYLPDRTILAIILADLIELENLLHLRFCFHKLQSTGRQRN